VRQIFGKLTKELLEHTSPKKVGKDFGYKVTKFSHLVEHIAKLSHLNKDYLLFFRGQNNDYRNKADASTFYPSIYRGERITQAELNYRFDMLNSASKMLSQEFKREKLEGYTELARKKYIQWSILQHYEVTGTPLSDVTQSLRVACSFAQMDNPKSTSFIYVFGLPYYTNRISINSEHDLVNIRLLSVMPPSALRPYYQEGYLVGTEDITTDYESKGELDLNRRLIAKFEIPSGLEFWGDGFNKIPKQSLYPERDILKAICDQIKDNLKVDVGNHDLGHFLKIWSEVESLLLNRARKYIRDVYNVRNALLILMKYEPKVTRVFKELDYLRTFRNKLVHNPVSIEPEELHRQTSALENLIAEYKKNS